MAVILNRPSLDKFESRIKPNGTLVLNTSMVDRRPQRTDLEILEMPMNEVAEEIGNPRGANMILLGAYLQKTQVVQVDQALQYFEVIFKGKSQEIIERNREAFLAGVQYAQNNW